MTRSIRDKTTKVIGDTESDRHQTLMTRYSLQMVCRQISREWSPMFYSTTTVVASRLEREKPEERRDGARRLAAETDDFQSLFLESLPTYNLQSIQKIYYNMTHRMRNIPDEVFIRHYCAKDFISILVETFSSLPSLKEIIIACYDDTEGPSTVVKTRKWEAAWEWMVSHDSWKSLQGLLQSGFERLASPGWCSVRKLHLVDVPYQDSLCAQIDEWQLSFCKGSAPTVTLGEELSRSVPVVGPGGKWIVLPAYSEEELGTEL
ncbi:hypothetical protein H2200_005192 [Cladophialophora chaetospira]|uniref:Uncharacterized protein n=1 Tax=Cladophialophora chaetospira TaxID=386627 RepID=A0AA38XBI9_9EURO|nr:hypothetical protein H2200_005192 [Cladophialophora chaetospira]